MNSIVPNAIDIERWIADNRARFKPPVSNVVMWPNPDLIVQMLSGPNARTDFHDDPYAEVFVQLKGTLLLRIVEDHRLRDVHIKEGEIYVCPAHVRHCPQRPADSFGLVIEIQRKGDEIDAFEWYCPNCASCIHRVEMKLRDPQADARRAGDIFNAFYDNVTQRTCTHCGTVHPRP
jgi:3-hydroxyanthranilate 3,4-dioxygenase